MKQKKGKGKEETMIRVRRGNEMPQQLIAGVPFIRFIYLFVRFTARPSPQAGSEWVATT